MIERAVMAKPRISLPPALRCAASRRSGEPFDFFNPAAHGDSSPSRATNNRNFRLDDPPLRTTIALDIVSFGRCRLCINLVLATESPAGDFGHVVAVLADVL